MFSVTLSMAGGLIAGKEGPFIHAGGIVGGGWAGMGSRYGPALAWQHKSSLWQLHICAVDLLKLLYMIMQGTENCSIAACHSSAMVYSSPSESCVMQQCCS